MACLDTTVLLHLAGRRGRRKRLAAEAALRRLEHDRPRSITRFTIAELFIGFELADDPSRERTAFDRILSRMQILEFDARSMRIYATLFVHLRSVGRSPGIMDTLIAAVTLAHGHQFVTRNPGHFRDVPALRVHSY